MHFRNTNTENKKYVSRILRYGGRARDSCSKTSRIGVCHRIVLCLVLCWIGPYGISTVSAQVPLPTMGSFAMEPGIIQLYFSAGGGTLNLSIDSAVAGQDPDQETDNTNELYWDAAVGVESKITVSTVCPGQSFSLYVELDVTSYGSGTEGTEQGEITLTDGMVDTDILRDIPAYLPGREGYGTLTYRAAATAAQGNSTEHGDDVHTVTFTIVEQ